MINYEKTRLTEMSSEDLKRYLTNLLVIYYNHMPAGNLFVSLNRAECEDLAELLIHKIRSTV